MNPGDQQRIARRHLERSAVVYVRQSDRRQVREHIESTALQRGLRERAIEMVPTTPGELNLHELPPVGSLCQPPTRDGASQR